MNLTQIKNHIISQQLLPLYLFTGKEVGIMDIYIGQMGKACGMQVVTKDTFKEAYRALTNTSSIIAHQPCIYVVRNDVDIISNEKVHKILQSHDWSGVLVCTFISLDKRTSFYKKNLDNICEFEPLDEKVLTKYIQKEIKLSAGNCKTLITICENSYSRIMQEINKIKHYRDWYNECNSDNETDPDNVFRWLVEGGTIYVPARDCVFEWVDAMMSRSPRRSFELLDCCIESGEPVLIMLSVLYNNAKQVLQVQAYEGSNICDGTGLTSWQVKCASKYKNRYTDAELVDIMYYIHEMEIGVKTGKYEDTIVIPAIMVKMLGKG